MKVLVYQKKDLPFEYQFGVNEKDKPTKPTCELDHNKIPAWLTKGYKNLGCVEFIKESDEIKVILCLDELDDDGHIHRIPLKYENGNDIELATIRLKLSNVSKLEKLKKYFCPDLIEVNA